MPFLTTFLLFCTGAMGGAAIVDSPVISVDDDTILGRWLFFFSWWNIFDRAKHGQLSATACVSNLQAAD